MRVYETKWKSKAPQAACSTTRPKAQRSTPPSFTATGTELTASGPKSNGKALFPQKHSRSNRLEALNGLMIKPLKAARTGSIVLSVLALAASARPSRVAGEGRRTPRTRGPRGRATAKPRGQTVTRARTRREREADGQDAGQAPSPGPTGTGSNAPQPQGEEEPGITPSRAQRPPRPTSRWKARTSRPAPLRANTPATARESGRRSAGAAFHPKRRTDPLVMNLAAGDRQTLRRLGRGRDRPGLDWDRSGQAAQRCGGRQQQLRQARLRDLPARARRNLHLHALRDPRALVPPGL